MEKIANQIADRVESEINVRNLFKKPAMIALQEIELEVRAGQLAAGLPTGEGEDRGQR